MLCSAAACVNPNRKRDAVGVLIGMGAGGDICFGGMNFSG